MKFLKNLFRGSKNSNLILVEGGEFIMGSDDRLLLNNTNGQLRSNPMHKVTLDSFYIEKYPVTFAQYDLFCVDTCRTKPNDENWGREDRPVINVRFQDAVDYCIWLSKRTGFNFRLPTEAEWEFAARGGNRSKNYRFSGSDILDEVAWHFNNSKEMTHPVGKKKSNELGIYDMSGNVLEWCLDNIYMYRNDHVINPNHFSDSSRQIIRGGSWYNYPQYFYSSARFTYYSADESNNIGFRVVRAIKSENKCSENHNWQNCKCILCWSVKDESHDWTVNCQKCSFCGKTNTDQRRDENCKCNNCQDNKDSGFFYCCINHEKEEAISMFNAGANITAKFNRINDENIDYGLTPIVWAVKKGDLFVINLLLELGVEINTQAQNGDSLLHIATGNAIQLNPEKLRRNPNFDLLIDFISVH